MDENDDQEPVCQSISIQRQRIMKVVDIMIEKIQIAICMQKLLSDEIKWVDKIGDTQHIKGILRKTRFGQRIKSIKRSTIGSKSRSRTTQSIKPVRLLDTRVNFTADLVSQMYRTPGIMEKVAVLLTTEESYLHLANTLNDLRSYIVDMVNQSALEERTYFKQVAYAWLCNEKYKKKYEELKESFEEKKMELEYNIRKKNEQKENYYTNIQKMNEKNEDDIKSIITFSELNMKRNYIASQEAQFLLSQEAKQVTAEYHSILENNLINEKQLRKQRTKTETVLYNLLAKYDNDIGELQEQLEVEQEGYNKEKEAYDKLMAKYEQQSIQYNELMQEKKEEEEKAWNEKYYAFIVERSCRIIQRWWRRIYWKKHKKKKGKGKKGKKK